MVEKHISRRTFLRMVGFAAGAAVLSACVPETVPQDRPERERSEPSEEEPRPAVESPPEEEPDEQETPADKPADEEKPVKDEPALEPETGEDEPVETEEPDLGELAGLPFLLPIEDIFSIKGRGTAVTGQVRRGTIEVGDLVEIVGGGSRVLSTVVIGIEQFQKTIDAAFPSENVGLLLRGIDKSDLQRGQVVAEPGSIEPYESFNAEISLLTKAEGGQKVVFNGYRPQIFIWTNEVTGEITLQDDVEMILPGESGAVRIELIEAAALETGVEFRIREDGRTIGTGVVTELLT